MKDRDDANSKTTKDHSPTSGENQLPILGLAATVFGGLAVLAWGGKKIVELIGKRTVKASCEISPEGGCRFFVIVNLKHTCVNAFIAATRANREGARKEPGNIAYEIYQNKVEQAKFILYEIYESKDAEVKHRLTPHYLEWKNKVASMMAIDREKKYNIKIPDDYTLID